MSAGKPSSLTSIAFNTGIVIEREKNLKILSNHLDVCNYQAVWDAPCDVCVWAEDAIAEIKGENK